MVEDKYKICVAHYLIERTEYKKIRKKDKIEKGKLDKLERLSNSINNELVDG